MLRSLMNSNQAKHVFMCDLKDDPDLIEEYKAYHKKVWPEIIDLLRKKGVKQMEIYLKGTRMFMIMEVNSDFSFEKAAKIDSDNPVEEKWQQLMWKYQQAPPGAKEGEKWIPMEKIFDLMEYS